LDDNASFRKKRGDGTVDWAHKQVSLKKMDWQSEKKTNFNSSFLTWSELARSNVKVHS